MNRNLKIGHKSAFFALLPTGQYRGEQRSKL